MSGEQQATAFRFGDWLVEPFLNRIRCGDTRLQLEPRSMEVLNHLLVHHREIVSIDDLLDSVWADRVVEANAVHRNINRIRRALQDDPHHARYIETIPKRGYRTVAPVRAISVNVPTDSDLLATLRALTPPFPAYQGDAPAVFACYAHTDRELVYHDLLRLRDGGINVWYDEGIAPGSEWTEELAAAINRCARFLFFVSPDAVASKHCLDELQYARERDCAIVIVHLAPTVLPQGLQLVTGRIQALLRFAMPEDEYLRKLVDALGPETTHQFGPAYQQIATNDDARATRLTNQASPPRALWRASLVGLFALAVAAALGIGVWWQRDGDLVALGDTEIRSIAVLPFADLSASRDLGPLAESVTRHLVTRLDEVPSIQVASTSAVVPLVERGYSLSDMAVALNTSIILSGYLQRDGDWLEIPVEIVRGADGRVLWSEVLRRHDAGEGRVSRFVAGELSRFLGRISTLTRQGPESAEAYRAWLNWHFHHANFRNWEEVKWIEQVIRLEPGYAWAHLDAAASYFRIAQDGQDTAWIERTWQSLEAARRSGLAEETAYRAQLGRYLAYLVGDLDRGETLLRETGDGFYAVLLMDSGIPEPAVRFFEMATAQLPANGEIWLGLGFARGMAGDLNGALAAYEEGLRRSPDHPYLLLQYARALAFLGRYPEAERSRERLKSLEPLPPGSHVSIRGGQIWLDAFQGRRETALTNAAALAEEGWHGIAGISFLELNDPRAAEQFERAAAAPVAGRRMISSWFHPKPEWMEHPVVRQYLDELGYTHAWRRELCHRAISYAAALGVALACERQG